MPDRHCGPFAADARRLQIVHGRAAALQQVGLADLLARRTDLRRMIGDPLVERQFPIDPDDEPGVDVAEADQVRAGALERGPLARQLLLAVAVQPIERAYAVGQIPARLEAVDSLAQFQDQLALRLLYRDVELEH